MYVNYLIVKKCQLDPKRSAEKTLHIWNFITKKLNENEWFSSEEIYTRFADVYRRGDITRALNLLEEKHGVIRREQFGVRVINRQYLHQLVDLVPLENVHNLAFIIENLFVSKNHSESNGSALVSFVRNNFGIQIRIANFKIN
ncbi:hypothetical protein [Ectobacillus sp. sgz5001026]|uniref:hypothetical protein n=1 Tax=Ectobacillus sp. sgz5001026 TaxID=3242473 RepID=UPI0036D29DA7